MKVEFKTPDLRIYAHLFREGRTVERANKMCPKPLWPQELKEFKRCGETINWQATAAWEQAEVPLRLTEYATFMAQHNSNLNGVVIPVTMGL